MWDLSNQYVAVGLTGGLITFVIFLAILSRSFGWLGNARKRAAGNRKKEWFCWCLGCALLAHVVGWFGCSYMAKMQMALFPLAGHDLGSNLRGEGPPWPRSRRCDDPDIARFPILSKLGSKSTKLWRVFFVAYVGEDPLRTLARVPNALYSAWVRATYPFASIGRDVEIHHTWDFRRYLAHRVKLGNSVSIGKDVHFGVYCLE